MNKYKPLIISIIAGILILLSFGLISECNDSSNGNGSVTAVASSDDVSNAVNNWINKKWDKKGYDSLSTLIQMSSNYTETIKANLQETLNGYYLHSMKVSFDDWKAQQCPDTMGFSIQSLMKSINDGMNQNPTSMYISELKNCVVEYSEMGQVAVLESKVNSCIRKQFDQSNFVTLKNSIASLKLKSHVVNCDNNAQKLDDLNAELQTFYDMVQNVDRF